MSRHNISISLVMTIFMVAMVSCGSEDIADVPKVTQPVKVSTVTSDILEPVRRFPGAVEAAESADIVSKVAGEVLAVHVRPGDEVKAGTLLLEIDPTDYELNLERAQADFALAKVSFERVESSRNKNIATQAEYDSAKSTYDNANVGLKQAENQLADTRITAPFNGNVVRVNTNQYNFVAAAQLLVHVQSIDNIDVSFQVPSDIVARLSDGDENRTAEIVFDALPEEKFVGRVKEFSADSDRSTRSFDVTLTLPSPPNTSANLLPGMDATVLVDLGQLNKNPTLTIPSHAVFQIENKNYVWLVKDNKVNKVEVTLGVIQGNYIVIESGLEVGQQVVSSGVHKLIDNQDVIIWSEK